MKPLSHNFRQQNKKPMLLQNSPAKIDFETNIMKDLYHTFQTRNTKSLLLSVIAGIMMICNTASAQTDPTV